MTTAAIRIGSTSIRRRRRRGAVLTGAGLLLLFAVWLALSRGAYPLSPLEVAGGLGRAIGLPLGTADPAADGIIGTLRAPRAVLGIVVGAGLALAGAVMQGLFRNPLADPGLIGVSSGAALGAVLVIVFMTALPITLPAALKAHALPVAAFLGGLATTLLVYTLSVVDGRTDVPTMLLAGIAINAITGAVIGIAVFISDDAQLRDLTFWTLGSLASASWSNVLPALALVLVAAAALMPMAAALNAVALGEGEAAHLGVDVEALKVRVVVLAALITGATVAAAGIIGFVGLVVPHVARLLIGADHRWLLPLSALGGASLVLVADTVARLVVIPTELPIGILMSGLGGPFFLGLLLHQRRRIVF